MTRTVQLLRHEAYDCTITSAWHVPLYNYGSNQGCWRPIRFENFDIGMIIISIIIIIIIIITIVVFIFWLLFTCSHKLCVLTLQRGKPKTSVPV